MIKIILAFLSLGLSVLFYWMFPHLLTFILIILNILLIYLAIVNCHENNSENPQVGIY